MIMNSDRNSIEKQIDTFDLENLIQRSDLESIISNFSAATGLASGIVKMRSDFEDLIDSEPNGALNFSKNLDPGPDRLTNVIGHSNFCKFIRKSRTGDLRCWFSDLKYCSEAFCADQPVIYRCHTGLLEIVAPIRLGSRHVANIYIGQIQSDLDENELQEYFPEFITQYRPLNKKLASNISEKEFGDIVAELDLDAHNGSITFENFKKLMRELPTRNKDEILTSIGLLKLIADLISRRATSQAIMQIMKDIDRESGISLDVASGLTVFLKNAKKLIQSNFSAVWLVERGEQVLNLAALEIDNNMQAFDKRNEFKIPITSLSDVTKYKGLILYETAAKIKKNLAHPNFMLNKENLKSWGSIPLLAGDRLLGLWTIGSNKEHAFGAELLNLLEMLASHAALFVKSADDRINIIHIMSKYEKDDLLESVVEKVPEMIHGKGCSIFLTDRKSERAYLVASKGLPKKLVGKAFYEPGEGLTGWVLQHGRILNLKIHEDRRTREKTIKSIAPDLRWKSKYQEFEKDSTDVAERPFLAAPLKTKDGRILGVIRISIRTGAGDFTKEDESLLSACADQIVGALERIRITTDLKHRIVQLRLLSDISSELTKAGDLNTLLDKIAEKAGEVLMCKGITIWLKNEDQTCVVLRGAFGFHKKFIGQHFYQLGEGLTGKVAQTGDPVWVTEAFSQPNWKGKYNDLFNEIDPPGRLPLIILPIKAEKDIIGVIKFTRRTTANFPFEKLQEFTEDEFNLAWVLSRQIAFVINNAQMLENLKKQIKQLREVQERIVQEREKAWKEFSAITAHRMGSDVADISGALYWLKRSISKNDDKQKVIDYLKRMDDTLRRIKKNVFDFIEFAKPPRLSFESIQINQLLKDVNDETNLDRVESIFNLEPDLPTIYADRESLTYTFRELFQNADKAVISDGKLTIQTRLNDSLNQIVIHISDNGKGIPRKLKHKIFEIGFRNQSGGTGLGLAIAKRYIEQHLGTIEEIGEECKGAHFIIRLPINQMQNKVKE